MATAKHGKKGRLLLDLSEDGDETPVIVPMLVDWTTDKTRDFLEVTSCDSIDNKEFVAGFGDYKFTFNCNMDADSDLVYRAADGQPRRHIFYPERDQVAGKRRYNDGLLVLSVAESGGVAAKLGQAFTAQAAGPITRAFV